MSKAIMLNPPGGGGEEKIYVYPADVTTRNSWYSNFPEPADSTGMITYIRKNPPKKEYQAVMIVRSKGGYVVYLRIGENGSPVPSGSIIHENAGAEYVYFESKLVEEV